LWRSVQNDEGFFLGLWFAISMVVDVAFYQWAHTRLVQSLRTVATERFIQTRPSAWWWPFRRSVGAPALPPVMAQ
jgi:hypothetical protein